MKCPHCGQSDGKVPRHPPGTTVRYVISLGYGMRLPSEAKVVAEIGAYLLLRKKGAMPFVIGLRDVIDPSMTEVRNA